MYQDRGHNHWRSLRPVPPLTRKACREKCRANTVYSVLSLYFVLESASSVSHCLTCLSRSSLLTSVRATPLHRLLRLRLMHPNIHKRIHRLRQHSQPNNPHTDLTPHIPPILRHIHIPPHKNPISSPTTKIPRNPILSSVITSPTSAIPQEALTKFPAHDLWYLVS